MEVQMLIIISGSVGGLPLLHIPVSLLRILPKKLYRVESSPNILLNSKFNVLKMERNVIDLSSLPARPHPPIRRKKAGNLSHDQRCDIQLLCSLGWKYGNIHKFTGCKISQIRYTCSHPATPKKNPGRPPILSQAQIAELVDFVYTLIKNCQISYK
jgi:hypothetical protein